jgi:hypothetical protein
LLGIILILSSVSSAQVDTASVSGVITDQSGAIVVGAEVRVTNADTNLTSTTTSNQSGVYLATGLKAGRYRVHVAKEGFRGIDLTDFILNVQDSVSRNFTLQVGSTSETVSVDGSALQINTQDATVSTVIDRQFAENLPMNGRSFQTLIQLTPGVVVTTTNFSDGGQFSVNGQRAASNYWMVDGVSANIGTGVSPTGNAGNGLSGSLGSFSALGGTNSLVSVDAMQEFRIQTSTYAPEFGRTPGGQISIVTRSGANQLHGTAFDYLRNDIFDANDWFNNFATPPLRKAQERQNDFGGTFSGPILKDRTFFFFSYEGLRLRLPQTGITTVPDLAARQNAVPAMQPFLNSFPFDPQQANLGNGRAQFNATFSNPATLDAYSLRIDHRMNDKLNLFGRYNYSPSEIVQRGVGGTAPLSDVLRSRITTQTGTVGVTWTLSPTVTNDLRLNYSRTSASGSYLQDTFGGAVAIASLPFPSPFTSQNAEFGFSIRGPVGLIDSFAVVGPFAQNVQRQINVVDALSMQKGSHSLKFGVDLRRLSPVFSLPAYSQNPIFLGVANAEAGKPLVTIIGSTVHATFLFRDLGAYAQDTWRVLPRLTLTYGLRWDLDFVPQSLNGPNFPAVTGFDLNDMSKLALASPGTPPYATKYGNVAPRFGIAYQLSQNPNWQTVIRGGVGVFYDLASSEMGNQVGANAYPFGASVGSRGGTFPSNPPPPPPAITAPPSPSSGSLRVIDPGLESPHTLEWNVAFEQALGKQQIISSSYIGAVGRRLLQSTAALSSLSPNITRASFVTNIGTSDYHALQVQFQRRLSRSLQALSSYTWSHSIDTGSAGSVGVTSNVLVPSTIAGSNRGPSDFDIRNAFSAGVTYDFPVPKINSFANAILRGWSVENFILVHSAPPVDISDANFFNAFSGGFTGDVRPDINPGQPFYLYGATCASALQAYGSLLPGQGCPGGKGFNPAAFMDPPSDPNTGLPLRQGNVPRNFLRGFGATQWDFAVHRDFPIRESLHLQFRAEMFNVLNHPNFGPPQGAFGFGGFGVSNAMLGQSLGGSGSTAAGGFNALYQIGGPRSIQLALKLMF